jgi:hypothetical protein
MKPEAARKRAAALALTGALMAGAVVLSRRSAVVTPPAPESAVWRMLDESRAGRVDGYLDCFTGSTRAELENTARGMTPGGFSAYLRESVKPVKGVAVYDLERTGPDAARLVVEYVYPEQNERQRMTLELEGGAWRIAAAEASQRFRPLIPYGKPVSEVP